MEVKEQLLKIAKRLQIIEDKDVNFIKNKKWIQLRKEQERIYYMFAKEEIQKLKHINDKKNICKIIEYQKFIERYEKK